MELPLFPLSTVLFPGGTLGLRIFEPRYLELVARCSREGSCFGVCLIVSGSEVGAPANPAPLGTAARIVDFTQLPDGLLGITGRGEDVFTVHSTRVGEHNLLIGDVVMRPADAAIPVPAEYALLATLLERLASQMGGELATAPKSKFDDAAWVAYRLGELLPLEHVDRLELLAEAEPLARLAKLAEWLPRFQRE